MFKDKENNMSKGDNGHKQEVEVNVEQEAVVTPVAKTDEEKKAAKAKANKAWADRRKEAMPRIAQFLKDNKESLGPIYTDIGLFVGMIGKSTSPKAPRSSAIPSINKELKDLLLAGPVNEMDIFKKFRIGQPEMKLKIRAFILVPKLEDRLWVDFNHDSGNYTIIGTGANPPEGWKGYLPVDKSVL